MYLIYFKFLSYSKHFVMSLKDFTEFVVKKIFNKMCTVSMIFLTVLYLFTLLKKRKKFY